VNIPSLNLKIGQMNRLQVVTELDFGLYLDGKKHGEILIPRKYVPEGTKVDDFLDVFVYVDSEDRLIATTETPYAMAGELAYLKVIQTNQIGAFLDWGLLKDLLVPFREQKEGMYRENYYMVYIYLDTASERLVASSKLHKHINHQGAQYAVGDEVDLIICDPFEIGYNVIIDKRYVGVIFKNEVFQEIEPGQKMKGFIKNLRPDGKIDAELQKSGEHGDTALSDRILAQIKSEGGFLPLTDKSPPENIYKLFKVSKRAYKKAVGGLYKRRMITIEEDGLRLN